MARTNLGHATNTDIDKWGGFEYDSIEPYKKWKNIKKKYENRKNGVATTVVTSSLGSLKDLESCLLPACSGSA